MKDSLSRPELRVLALDVMGWMDAVLGERCSCASPLSISLFSVIIDKEVNGHAQPSKNVAQTVSSSKEMSILIHYSCAGGYISTSHGPVRAARSAAPHTSCKLKCYLKNSNHTLWDEQSVTGRNCGSFCPLTRTERLQCGTISPGSCH